MNLIPITRHSEPIPQTLSISATCPSHTAKRVFDLFFGLLLTPLILPMIATIWVAVRLTSRGPGFYTQVRVGLRGKMYRILKIRSMYHNCELQSGIKWSTKKDSRVTPLGKVLRKLHMDELPQLWNVLRGDMSLVGPRPERPELVGPLAQRLPGYEDRLLVRPGVTGLAQIQLPPDTDIESVRTKLVLDLCYVKSQSLWLDIRLIVGTLVYLCGTSYRNVRRLCRLPNPLRGKVEEPGEFVQTCGSANRLWDVSDRLANSPEPAAIGKAT